jgi:FixJ family two-component response regulator
MLAKKTVFVIDDDPTVRDSVCALVSSMGCRSQGFSSAEDFLARENQDERGVIVVDLRMRGMSGLELQEQLRRRNNRWPLIVLTAYAQTATTVRAIQAGAVTMIDKPYHDNDLWDAIRTALEREQEVWIADQQQRVIRERLAELTATQRRVAELIVAGLPNKAIAKELGIALRTVEKRRHEVLEKMNVGSVPELVVLLLNAGEGGKELGVFTPKSPDAVAGARSPGRDFP